jgi:hypothetical protein
MEQIVLQAAAGKTLDRNTRVGRPLDHVLPASAANILAELVRPDGGKVDVKIKPDGDVSRFHYEATELSGPYKLRLTPGDEAGESIFTAAIDPIESDLVKLDRTTLASANPGWNFSYLTNWEDLTDNAVAVAHRGEMHRSLLLAVLALLLIESLLAWRFGHHAS